PELEKLWEVHAIIPLLSEYRELTKLQSTYVEALPKLVGKDGRVHTSFNQTVAATGRLSSSDPNLQNIPIKTELGREIRKAFVAPRGKTLIAADYSQIELRLAAVIAKDKPFIQAFQEGADIHTRTAAEIWDVTEALVTKEQRRAAKAINFGILYGMGPRSLSRSTGLTMEEAKHFIDRYFEIHHAIRDYLDNTKLKAHTVGYVETLFGRRRYLPEIQSGVPMLVASAERMAVNMPIQGTQADIVKMAMLRVDGWLKKVDWPAKMLLQVHDELVLEVDSAAIEPVAVGVKEMMESVASFEVPLVVEIELGNNWGEMK
ncbi:DNA polymerase I, partial [Patescibacteria group bacterium]